MQQRVQQTIHADGQTHQAFKLAAILVVVDQSGLIHELVGVFTNAAQGFLQIMAGYVGKGVQLFVAA